MAFATLRSFRRVGVGAAGPSAHRPAVALFGSPGPQKLSGFSGAEDTLKSMAKAALGPRGEQSFPVRQMAEWIVRDVEPKDYLGEILCVRNFFVQRSPWRENTPIVRYTNDPRHVELVKDPQRLVEEIAQNGTALADCDEYAALAATLLLQLGRECEFVALGFGQQLTHVGLRCQEPKSHKWIWLDSVAGPREREAAATASMKLFWSLD